MTKVHLLGANRSYDRSVQTVSVNQVVMLEGYNYDSYVVYEVSRNEWGITYHLINLETHEFHTSDLIRPLSEKFGIGIYYDDANPKFLDPLETAVLLTEAKEKKAEAERKAEEAREEYERIAKIGAERLRPLIPTDAKAVIIGTLRVNERDSYTDYYDYSIGRTVILGFSKHTRNLFSEMRKHAANFEGTAYLAEYNADYEHRENYSMGDGMYLGEHKYSGWTIEKEPIYARLFCRSVHPRNSREKSGTRRISGVLGVRTHKRVRRRIRRLYTYRSRCSLYRACNNRADSKRAVFAYVLRSKPKNSARNFPFAPYAYGV